MRKKFGVQREIDSFNEPTNMTRGEQTDDYKI